jgi:hypothetical protein
MATSSPTSKFKLKFFGMKWRFLKVDLEKEALPALIKQPELIEKELEQRRIMEQSVVLETFEKGLNIQESISLSIFQSSMGSTLPGCALSEPDSVFTEEDIIQGIRNMQIFHQLEPSQVRPPCTARSPAPPSKPLLFSPRPPSSIKPSHSIQSDTSNSAKGGFKSRRKMEKAIPLQEQIKSLDISRSFKM